MSRYRIRRLERIEGLAAQRQHQVEMDDLEQVAESARERILQYLQARLNGSPLPALERSADCGTSDEARGARERLRARLDETGQRLRRYAELRDMYGIR
jgi:hypothetical protein